MHLIDEAIHQGAELNAWNHSTGEHSQSDLVYLPYNNSTSQG